MSGPELIHLEPECCADPDLGRVWCRNPPAECEHGAEWAKYIRADIAATDAVDLASQMVELRGEAERLRAEVARLTHWRDTNAKAVEAISGEYLRACECILWLNEGDLRDPGPDDLDSTIRNARENLKRARERAVLESQ